MIRSSSWPPAAPPSPPGNNAGRLETFVAALAALLVLLGPAMVLYLATR